MEKITIEFLQEPKPNEQYGGWRVEQGDKSANGLGYDEMLGLFAALTMPEGRPCLQWMKTKEQHKARRKFYEEKQQPEK